MSEKITNLILKPYFKKILEERRDYFFWIIDRAIKREREKFEGKRKLKKQQKLWKKYFFEKTESFEEYLEKQNEKVLSLFEHKNEIANAKDFPNMLNVWKKVKKLLNHNIGV